MSGGRDKTMRPRVSWGINDTTKERDDSVCEWLRLPKGSSQP